MPCSHCVARKIPELCKAYTPGQTDKDVNSRLARLEHIVEIALPQFCSPSPGHRASYVSEGDDDSRSQTSEQDTQDPSGGTLHGGKWYGNSASGSVAQASVLEQLQNVIMPGSNHDGNLRGHNGLHGGTSGDTTFTTSGQAQLVGTTSSTTIIDSVHQDSEPSAADNLKMLIQDCGVSPHKISELLQELPPRRFSEALIDHYFSSINWTRYPVSERDFRAAYSSISTNSVEPNPNDVRFLPLLFVVLAISVRLAPEQIAGDARSKRITSLRYYWSSRRSALISAAVQPDCLEMVLTRLLVRPESWKTFTAVLSNLQSARFLTFDRRITECWSQLGAAVRTAQALGLHRDGSTLGVTDPAQIQYRRRIWSYLYHADRTFALILGRPNAIQDDYTSTLPPLNVDDVSSLSQMPTTPPSLSNPTRMTFVILRHTLSTIIGRIVHHFQQVRTPSHYSDVLAIDDDLMSFVTNLPPHFSLSPDTSLDETLKYIPVHRFFLITEIWFVRISLHRPYLLRRVNSDRYYRSRKACFESAMKDFEVRDAFRNSMPKETQDFLSNAYREFQTAMIGGIYLVLHPKGKDAAAMHTILDSFMKDHEGVREMNETTRRELKTIEFLKIKGSVAESVEDSRRNQDTSVAVPPILDKADLPPNSHLLLGMPQSTSIISQTSFPSLVGRDAPSPKIPPSIPYWAPTYIRQPAFQRLQHSAAGDVNSPSGSGSPAVDDEEFAAQSLLDHWYNAVSNGPTVDGSIMGSGMWGGLGDADYPGWSGAAPAFPGSDLTGADGSDWSYWETLVNQIQRSS